MNVLDNLLKDDFLIAIGFSSSAKGIYHALSQSSQVASLREAIRTREITPEKIRVFVSGLTESFERGVQFPYELQLAAICVALENVFSEFSEDFLLDLAKLDIIEITLAPKVAAICLEDFYQKPKQKISESSCQAFPINDLPIVDLNKSMVIKYYLMTKFNFSSNNFDEMTETCNG